MTREILGPGTDVQPPSGLVPVLPPVSVGGLFALLPGPHRLSVSVEEMDLAPVHVDDALHRTHQETLHLNRLTGGNTPNASQVRKITSVGWPAMHGIFAFGMCSIG